LHFQNIRASSEKHCGNKNLLLPQNETFRFCVGARIHSHQQITQLPKNHSTLYTPIYSIYTHKHAPWDSIHRMFSPNVTDTPPTPILGSRPYRESLWPTIRPARPCTHTVNRHSVWRDQCWFLPGDSKEFLEIWVGPAKDRQRNGPWQGSLWRLLRTKTIVVSVLVVLFVATCSSNTIKCICCGYRKEIE